MEGKPIAQRTVSIVLPSQQNGKPPSWTAFPSGFFLPLSTARGKAALGGRCAFSHHSPPSARDGRLGAGPAFVTRASIRWLAPPLASSGLSTRPGQRFTSLPLAIPKAWKSNVEENQWEASKQGSTLWLMPMGALVYDLGVDLDTGAARREQNARFIYLSGYFRNRSNHRRRCARKHVDRLNVNY